MNVADKLPAPLNTFTVDVPANTYYDFELPPSSTYPLPGVTYPVDYGNIPDYTGEDEHELDLFVGNEAEGLAGNVYVQRGADRPNEHKFFVAITSAELGKILEQLDPVLVSHEQYPSTADLLEAIESYSNKT